MRSIQLEKAISGESAKLAGVLMPHPGDPGDPAGVRSYPRAAAPPGSGGAPDPACSRARGRAAQRDLLLSLVLEHAARRPVHPLDAGRPRAALRHRLAVLSGPR